MTLRTLRSKYEKGQPITMVTAYDYPSAVHVSLQLQLPMQGVLVGWLVAG